MIYADTVVLRATSAVEPSINKANKNSNPRIRFCTLPRTYLRSHVLMRCRFSNSVVYVFPWTASSVRVAWWSSLSVDRPETATAVVTNILALLYLPFADSNIKTRRGPGSTRSSILAQIQTLLIILAGPYILVLLSISYEVQERLIVIETQLRSSKLSRESTVASHLRWTCSIQYTKRTLQVMPTEVLQEIHAWTEHPVEVFQRILPGIPKGFPSKKIISGLSGIIWDPDPIKDVGWWWNFNALVELLIHIRKHSQ